MPNARREVAPLLGAVELLKECGFAQNKYDIYLIFDPTAENKKMCAVAAAMFE